MAEQTESLRILLPPDLKKRVLDDTKSDPRYVYNERPSHSALAREAFEFFLLHKSTLLNRVDEQTDPAA